MPHHPFPLLSLQFRALIPPCAYGAAMLRFDSGRHLVYHCSQLIDLQHGRIFKVTAGNNFIHRVRAAFVRELSQTLRMSRPHRAAESGRVLVA